MAETVKKSRIVSDDDLEESLMQEFNIRLKHCMSQEQMQEPSDDEEEHVKEVIKLEFNTITTNGNQDDSIYDEVCPINSNERFLFEERNVYADTNGVSFKNKLNNVHDEELHPEEDSVTDVEGIPEKKPPQSTTEEVIYDEVKNVRPVLQLPTTCLTDMSDTIEEDNQDVKGSVKDRMLLSTDDTSCLLFTQTVTSPMLTPSEENIDFLKGFQRQSSQNTTSTSENTQSENIVSSKIEDVDQQNEDITESSNISDKLDVEYENIPQINMEGDISEVDNLGPSTLGTNQIEMIQENSDIVRSEHIYEAIEDDGDEKQEEIYENMEILRKQSLGSLTDNQRVTKEFLEREIFEEEKNRYEENIYENIEDTEEEEIELSNADSVEELQRDAPEKSIPDVCLEANEKLDSQIKCSSEEDRAEAVEDNKSPTLISPTVKEELQIKEDEDSNYIVVIPNESETIVLQEDVKSEEENEENLSSKFIEIPENQLDVEESIPCRNKIENLVNECIITDSDIDDKSIDNPSKMVDALKTKFMTNATAEIVKTASIEKTELNQLKTIDIMKQINKFENKSPSKDDGDEENSISSSEMTESRFVETTTTIETSSSSVQDKSLKKKKSKKSRSHDKENISVNETNIDDDTNMQEENFYNVNVKSLCRSFGDLTKIEDDKQPKEKPIRDRTKSLGDARSFEILKMVDNVFSEVSVKALREKFSGPRSKTNTSVVVNVRASEQNNNLKSSFNKFDALQKKNVLHVRSSDSSTAQEKFNGAAPIDNTNCKACGKVVFQMEQIKAEKSVWHKNCFRCQECSKQLTVDTYQSNEGTVYCKPHFKSLFAPKVVEDEAPPKPRKHELIIRENQPLELPPDVVRASDKPDLGLEELQSLNVRERFQVFENFEESQSTNIERGQVSVKRSPSILSKLAKFQSKGMDVGVTDDSLNGIPIEESSSEEEQEEEIIEGEDADLIRAKKAQKEKPFHFTNMSDVKSKWEQGEQNSKDVRREERKQEIQSIRDRLFMGKQGKMKEAYQQAVMESESCTNLRKAMSPPPEACDTRTLKEKFEKGETYEEGKREPNKEADDMSVFESGISKKSRSIFLELDANASKAPQLSPVSPPKAGSEVKKAKEALMARQSSEDTVKSSEQVDDIKVETSDIQQRFKFFEAYKEPEQKRKVFRITPPREGQTKGESPEREVYRDPDIVRSVEQVEDSVIAQESHTTTKVLNKFRQMEENMYREPLPLGPKPLKRFTPPPEPTRPESSSEGEGSESEEESEGMEEIDQSKMQDTDLVEAQKAARARQLRAKFEKWEAKEIKREQQQQQVNIIEEIGDEQAQIESTRALRARFESLQESQSQVKSTPKVKVNRFVDTTSTLEVCYGCKERVYPLEKISIHEQTYHKKCFKCKECNTVLRMDSYTYNQGLLYCIPHFKRLFIAKGNYDTAFGLEQRKEKWNTTVA